MADSEHLEKLLEGVGAWNDWREANTKIVPDLIEADLSRAELSGADLHGADLREADLSDAYLNEADLKGADLRRADLSWAELSQAFLRRANLRQAKLTGTHAYGVALYKANLGGADLGHAYLHDAYLSGANLTGANLGAADLQGADLTGANLGAADLAGANVSRADLSGADFTGAYIAYAILGDNDLSVVKGLETVRHGGPSTIGIDTIYRSQGKIPLAFLRGAGVPENFIEYMGSLTGKALEFYSCFISYSTKDQEFADRLHADLQNKGVRCWFAPHDLLPGEKIYVQIDEAIRMHERLLLILSPNSMDSEWVKTEIRKARKRERTEKKRVLFPVRLVSFEALRDWEFFDADEGKDLAVEIREYYMPPDSSDWKNHDSYTKGLQNLLRGLKTKGLKAA